MGPNFYFHAILYNTGQYHCIGNTIQYDYIKAYRCLPNLNKSKKFCENPSQSASGPRKKFSLKVKERKCSQLTAGLRAASNQRSYGKLRLNILKFDLYTKYSRTYKTCFKIVFWTSALKASNISPTVKVR